VQAVDEVLRDERSQFKFDKRMTGSTAIDEVLQEVVSLAHWSSSIHPEYPGWD